MLFNSDLPIFLPIGSFDDADLQHVRVSPHARRGLNQDSCGSTVIIVSATVARSDIHSLTPRATRMVTDLVFSLHSLPSTTSIVPDLWV